MLERLCFVFTQATSVQKIGWLRPVAHRVAGATVSVAVSSLVAEAFTLVCSGLRSFSDLTFFMSYCEPHVFPCMCFAPAFSHTRTLIVLTLLTRWLSPTFGICP